MCHSFSFFFCHRFEDEMNKLKETSKEAWEWLSKLDQPQWTRSYFNKFPKCDVLLNNMRESFNATILEARDKPIITLLELVRRYIMKRIESKREAVEKWKHPVGPKI